LNFRFCLQHSPQLIADALDAIHACSNAAADQITLQSFRATGFAGTLMCRSNLDFQTGIFSRPVRLR
jgi:hypothetical protein